MKFKKLLSIIMVSAISLTALCYPLLTSAKADYSYKIDPALAKKLDKMSDDDTISVSIWLTDIDYNEVYDHSKKDLEILIKKDLLTNDSLELLKLSMFDISFFAKNEYTNYNTDRIKQLDNKVSNIESNEVLRIMRKNISLLMMKNNLKKYNMLFPEKRQSNFSELKQDENIIFVSQYAPLINIKLKKFNLLNAIKSNFVETVNEYLGLKVFNDDNNNDSIVNVRDGCNCHTFNPCSCTNISNNFICNCIKDFYEVMCTTNISSIQGAYGLGGYRIKIGIHDYFSKSTIADYLDYNNISYVGNNTGDESFLGDDYACHGSIVTSVIQGFTDSVTGVTRKGSAPNADIYWVSPYEKDIYQTIDIFLNENCNVFSTSLGYPGDTQSYNQYSQIGKFWDYVVKHDKLHIVSCSSNDNCYTISSGNISYNTILVGYSDVHGTIISGDGTTGNGTIGLTDDAPYKPDLLSYFRKIKLFSIPNNSGYLITGGTSYATPTVAGAIAAMCQASSVLKINPVLMKSLLLSGTKVSARHFLKGNVLSTEINNLSPSTTTEIALDHEYGAGILNAMNTYQSWKNGYFEMMNFASQATSTSFSKRIVVGSGSLIRFCLTWDKVNYKTIIDDEIIYNSSLLDTLSLTITTPSGKTYKSDYVGDNKQMISFNSTENGYYTVTITRTGNCSSANDIECALSYMTSTMVT